MNPADYDAWYNSPCGKWIGEREYRLLLKGLALSPAGQIPDLGCGTGWFTRRLATPTGRLITEVDLPWGGFMVLFGEKLSGHP